MVYRRKRTFRKKRTTRRYGTRPMYKRRRTLGQRSFKVMRWSSYDSVNNCHLTFVGNDTVPNVENSAVFAMSHVNGSGELVSLFDNFRIHKVLYRWVLYRNPDQVTTTANKGIYPRIVWTHDFNDSTPIGRAQIYQRANLREEYFSDNHQRSKWYTLKSAVLAQMYESGVATAYQPQWKKWLDTSDNATPHYGFKYSIDQNYAGMQIRLEAKILMECKGIS